MHVIMHNAVSVDGRIDGFLPNIELYYGLAGTWDFDAQLVGADTLIEGEQASDDAPDPEAPPPGDETSREEGAGSSLLVVTDSRWRIDEWDTILDQPFWGDVLVLCSDATPDSYLTGLDRREISYVVAGDDHVDLESARDVLVDRGIETVLVDSGGTLSGTLLSAGLVDEVSVLVHPVAVGGTSARSFIRGPDPDEPTPLDLLAVEQPADDVIWLRYEVSA